MSKDDDDTPDDVNSLMEMIRAQRRRKRYQSSLMKPRPAPAASRSGPAPGSGDFSALMKKLGMADRQEAAPSGAPAPETSPVQSSSTPGEEQISSLDDLLEDAGTPAEEAAAEVKPDPGDVNSVARAGSAGTPADTPREPVSPPEGGFPSPSAEPAAPREPGREEVIEVIDEDPKAAMRKPKTVKSVAGCRRGGTSPKRDRDR